MTDTALDALAQGRAAFGPGRLTQPASSLGAPAPKPFSSGTFVPERLVDDSELNEPSGTPLVGRSAGFLTAYRDNWPTLPDGGTDLAGLSGTLKAVAVVRGPRRWILYPLVWSPGTPPKAVSVPSWQAGRDAVARHPARTATQEEYAELIRAYPPAYLTLREDTQVTPVDEARIDPQFLLSEQERHLNLFLGSLAQMMVQPAHLRKAIVEVQVDEGKKTPTKLLYPLVWQHTPAGPLTPVPFLACAGMNKAKGTFPSAKGLYAGEETIDYADERAREPVRSLFTVAQPATDDELSALMALATPPSWSRKDKAPKPAAKKAAKKKEVLI